MREVKCKVSELLEKVKTNRGTHISEYAEAVEGYKDQAKAAIEKAMTRLKARIDELEGGEVLVLGHVTFDLVVPENHAKDYDQVILMLEMSVDEVLTIRSDEFACYVMDDWSWKEDWSNTTRMYNKK